MLIDRNLHGKLLRGVAPLLIFALSAAMADEVSIAHGELQLNGDFVVAGGAPPQDVVLLVHGRLAHKDMEIIQALQDVLLEYERSSLAITLSLGIDDRHGFFPCESAHDHRIDDALGEIDAWIDWLKQQGTRNVTLLGHSLGAHQVARYVSANPGSVDKVVLLAPPDGGPSRMSPPGVSTRRDGRDWFDGIRFLQCDDATVSRDAWLSYFGPDASMDSIPLIEQMQPPTLVISGTEDENTSDLPARIGTVENPRVQHVAIDGAGHFFRDLYAYDVVDAVVAFTASHSAGEIPRARELARLAGTGIRRPIIVFISQASCPFCRSLRRQVLEPMLRAGEFEDRAMLVEVPIDAGFVLQDFAGEAVEGAHFALRYGVFVTPTMLIVDDRGRSLADPIVGTPNLEFYRVYLNRAIDRASEKLQTG